MDEESGVYVKLPPIAFFPLHTTNFGRVLEMVIASKVISVSLLLVFLLKKIFVALAFMVFLVGIGFVSFKKIISNSNLLTLAPPRYGCYSGS